MSRVGKTLSQFLDVIPVLDAAIAAGGGRYTLPTSGQAVNWRQRAYTLRSIMRKADQARHDKIPGYSPSTPYDGINLSIDGEAVVIKLLKIQGSLTSLDGVPVETKEIFTADQDPLTNEDQELVKSLIEELDL